jgi:hypothetical protein
MQRVWPIAESESSPSPAGFESESLGPSDSSQVRVTSNGTRVGLESLDSGSSPSRRTRVPIPDSELAQVS